MQRNTSPFTAGPAPNMGWEVAWLERPDIVVLGVFDHVLGPRGSTDFEQLAGSIQWPDDVAEAFLPAEKSWVVDVPSVCFQSLAGVWVWSPQRKRLRKAGAQWRRSLDGRITASLPPALGKDRLDPFLETSSIPDQVVSWAFVPKAEVRLSVAAQWARYAQNNAAGLLMNSCERILALQDGHIFVVTLAARKGELAELLRQTASKFSLSLAEGRTLHTAPVR